MDIIKSFINEYGMTILYAVITTIAGYIGTRCKAIYERYINTKIKKDVANTVVSAVEQIYKDLHGEEKFNQAVIAASEMLTEKGISATELELRMLIEAAVNEFNKSKE